MQHDHNWMGVHGSCGFQCCSKVSYLINHNILIRRKFRHKHIKFGAPNPDIYG